MTEPQSAAASTESVPQAIPPAAPPSDAQVSAQPQPAANAPQKPAEDLPEWEPLSPELVEDEAIRGDFMLRWAAVLLGFLLGCRHIAETQTLVRIRTGEHIAAHGFLPPRTDIFSYTAGERSWVNLGWLFDLLAAGLHAIAGPAALSVGVGAASAVLIYWLVNLTRSKLPTWWHAVCAGVLLLSLHPQLVPLPKLMSLLGIVWTLRGLLQWNETKQSRSLWCLVATLVVWANLDSHAVFGWLLLAGYGAGQFLSATLQRRAAIEPAEKLLWQKVIGAGFGALLLNPFGWNSVLALWVRFDVELKWLRGNASRIGEIGFASWQSPFDAAQWKSPTPVVIAAAVMLLMAVVTTFLNRRRVDLGLLLATVLVVLVGAMSWEEFALALVALAVLAALNGQDWYRDNCRQEYSIETLEVVYSRGGRAVTVIAFGALAYFAISGRLMGRDGNRVGFGWTPLVAANAAGLADDLKDLNDARLMQFRLDQGDVAIWTGHKVFFDSRVALYARGGENIFDQQKDARASLRPAKDMSKAATLLEAPDTSDRSRGEEVLKRFEVTHLMPRLWGQQPLLVIHEIAQSADWQLQKYGATCAIFGRRSKDKKQNEERAVNFKRLAFRDCKPTSLNTARMSWPMAPTAYQNFLSLKGTPISNAGRRAQNNIGLLSLGRTGAMRLATPHALGLCFLAIRDAQAAIAEDNSDVSAYLSLADAYSVLGQVESQINAANGVNSSMQRHFQSTAALQQALMVEPDNLGVRLVLLDKHRAMNRVDVMHAEIQKILAIYKKRKVRTEDDIANLARLRDMSAQLEPLIERLDKAIAEGVEKNADPVSLANYAKSQGFPLRALTLLEADKLKLAGNMQAHLMMAMLMSELGRLEDASSLFVSLDGMQGVSEAVFGAWQAQAAFVAMSQGDYDRAFALASKQRDSLLQATFSAILGTSPLRSFDVPIVATKSQWATARGAASEQVLFNVADQTALFNWTAANAMLEAGKCSEALAALKLLLQDNPQSSYAALGSVYFQLLTDEPLSVSIPSETVPVLFEDGPNDPVIAPQPKTK